jgi:putative component of membrane protein insertase Oxa1/YidC/SpoIIIJ protein YidD
MDLLADDDDVQQYCKNHPLNRPPIPWFSIVLVVVGFEALLSFCLHMLSLSAGSYFIFHEAIHLIVLLCWGRVILTWAVRIYQRYAPESVRRQCSCMPSCSEYALLALEKYWWPKALKLTIWRVVHTCQQPGYKKDYP